MVLKLVDDLCQDLISYRVEHFKLLFIECLNAANANQDVNDGRVEIDMINNVADTIWMGTHVLNHLSWSFNQPKGKDLVEVTTKG